MVCLFKNQNSTSDRCFPSLASHTQFHAPIPRPNFTPQFHTHRSVRSSPSPVRVRDVPTPATATSTTSRDRFCSTLYRSSITLNHRAWSRPSLSSTTLYSFQCMWAKGEAPNISKIGIHSRFNTVSKPMYFTALCCSGPGRRWKVSLVNQTNNNDPTLNDVVVQLISGVQVGPEDEQHPAGELGVLPLPCAA